jgi:hypothetical protein
MARVHRAAGVPDRHVTTGVSDRVVARVSRGVVARVSRGVVARVSRGVVAGVSRRVVACVGWRGTFVASIGRARRVPPLRRVVPSSAPVVTRGRIRRPPVAHPCVVREGERGDARHEERG